jgi:uncharacterized membrane protein (GlpM family)
MVCSQEVDRRHDAPIPREIARLTLTHVYPIIQLVVDDLQQANDMSMTTFFHYRNLFPYFMLETSEFFCKWCVRRRRNVSPAEHVHLLGAWVITFDSLYGLMKAMLTRSRPRNGQRMITNQLATIIRQVPTYPYFAMLTLSDSVATQILVHDRSAVIIIPVA